MQERQATRCPDQGKARMVVEGLTRKILGAAAERRQGAGKSSGARSPAGLGQARRSLGVVWDPARLGVPAETPVGYKTARAALPPVLAALAPQDPRLRAATMFAATIERIDSVKGVDLQGGDHKGGVSDGGVTTKIKHAARFNRVRDAVNGWAPHPVTGVVDRRVERVVLPVRRRRGKAQDIKAFELLCAVCVDGRDMREILVSHGWSPHSRLRKALALELLELLDVTRAAIGVA
ncbi:hypothetical protein R2601_22896 [Salipiger bermudensis HTCC2601]|uniref:Uncharacterized protein n=2 Tax=Salipiger TaxID=263377 RepID=Q0FLL4_SALBH|nr:hypothetical protein R2601_22896 [Salipiger bermudensis HTCC2601]